MKRMLLTLLAVASAAAAIAVAAPLASPDMVATAGENRFVNPPVRLGASNSPTLARNPLQPTNLVLTHRVDRPGYSAVLESSLDGGATWQVTSLPLPPGKDRPYAPDTAFAPDGTLFVAYLHLEGNGHVPANLWVAASKDGGRTLSAPVQVAGRLAYQPRLAVDHRNTVHVTWLQANDVGFLKFVGGPNPVVTARSTDGGTTFSAPVQVSDQGRRRVGAASPVVDSRGNLVVLYQDFKGDRRDFEFLEGPPWPEPFALVVSRSTDGGRSFSPGVEVDAGLVPARRFPVFLVEFPTLAAGTHGTLYVAWADARNGDEDVFLRRSDDGGRSWKPPVRVNDNRLRDGTSQYLAKVAVAPNGRVDLVYLDRRRDRSNVMTDASLASSQDGGKTFRSARLSSRSFDSRIGSNLDDMFGVDFGSRLGLLSLEQGPVAAWTDSRLGSEGTGRQDIAVAAATLRAGPPDRARALASGGLVLLGLTALTLWLVSGRRSRVGSGPDARGDETGAASDLASATVGRSGE